MRFEDTLIGRPNTIKTYKGLLNNHIIPNTHKAQFQEEDLVKLIKIWQQDLAPSTVKLLISLTHRYIKWKTGYELDTKALIKMIERSQQETEIKALSKHEVDKLLKICEELDKDFFPILLCGVHAGLRRGEIFGLRCGDIDHIKNRIIVRHSYNGPTKNGKSRTVPMSNKLNKTLDFCMMKHPEELVFHNINTGPRLARLCNQLNIEEIRFHDLRHTFATLALEHGISPKVVQEWLGHSNLTTTLNIYWSTQRTKAKMDFLPGE